VSDKATPEVVSVPADEELARELVERARTEGVELVGPGGLLTGLTRTVLETALEVEMEDHLGYAKGAGLDSTESPALLGALDVLVGLALASAAANGA
jgi:hypothetical protein